MTVADWLRESRDDIRTHGVLSGAKFAAQEFAVGAGRRLGQRLNYGDRVWNRDWDVLVLLDACRHDLMQEAAASWSFLPDDVPAMYSAASMSEEWIERHTEPAYRDAMAETALVSANAFTRSDRIRADDWAALDEVWKHSWSDDYGTVLTRAVTNQAIHQWRHGRQDRMIVWYLQPHAPFVHADWSHGFETAKIGNGEGYSRSIWHQYRDGDLSRDTLWAAYRENLDYALADVELLLENLDASVAISSDHANCLGEFGIYGHPKYVPAPSLKRVPWVETEAVDERTHAPNASVEADTDLESGEVTSRLRDLGYV
jgi:hypothetical protein